MSGTISFSEWDGLVVKYDAKCRQLNKIIKERNDFEMKLNGISKRLSGAITARHVIGKKFRELGEKYDALVKKVASESDDEEEEEVEVIVLSAVD